MLENARRPLTQWFWSTVPLKLKLLGAEIQEWPTAIPESHLLKLVQLSRKASVAKRSDLQLCVTFAIEISKVIKVGEFIISAILRSDIFCEFWFWLVILGFT